MPAKIKKGDKVVVIAGRDKGKTGEVLQMIPSDNRAVVRGVNLVKRHQRQTQQSEGGIITKEAPIQLSNIAIADPKDGKPTASVSRLMMQAPLFVSLSVQET